VCVDVTGRHHQFSSANEAIEDRKSDTPNALWDARFASVLVPGPATPPGRLNLMLPARDGEALIDGCLPVAVMVGEDAR
jgi:hypothetical protein